MAADIDREISELHTKTNQISNKLSTLNGRLDGTLGHLATKTDIEKMKNEIGDAVSTSIEKHSRACPALTRARKPSKSPVPPAPQNNKVVIALTSVITSAVAALVAVIYKLIG